MLWRTFAAVYAVTLLGCMAFGLLAHRHGPSQREAHHVPRCRADTDLAVGQRCWTPIVVMRLPDGTSFQRSY